MDPISPPSSQSAGGRGDVAREGAAGKSQLPATSPRCTKASIRPRKTALIEALIEFLRKGRAGQIILETAPALILFFVDPLGVVAYQARVIDNSIAVLTQFWHKSEPERQLAVVLIDQEALNTWRVDWPIAYERTAGLIHALACARAVGVFFDFTLSEKFNLAEGKSDLESGCLQSPDRRLRRRKPSYEGPEVNRQLLVSVNSDLSDRVNSLPTSYPVGSCDP